MLYRLFCMRFAVAFVIAFQRSQIQVLFAVWMYVCRTACCATLRNDDAIITGWLDTYYSTVRWS